MTNEEAINVLNDYDINFERNTAEEVAEAHEMAIKALQQQPSENEKIIRISKGTLKARTDRYVIYDVEWLKTHFNTTEAKIYGQPTKRTEERTEMRECDYISRKAVLDSLHSCFAEGFNEDRWWNSTHVLDIINKAPSVEALQEHQHYKDLAESYEKTINKLTKAIAEEQQKTGHWIEHKHGGIEHIECSECGVWFLKADLPRKSYCPNCGSCNGDMVKNIMRDIANNNGGAK